MELIAVKKNSETISTLPFNVMTVMLSTEVMVCVFDEAGENDASCLCLAPRCVHLKKVVASKKRLFRKRNPECRISMDELAEPTTRHRGERKICSSTRWLGTESTPRLNRIEIYAEIASSLRGTHWLSTMTSLQVGRFLFAAPRRAAGTAARRELSTLLTAVEEYPG